jgi:aminoglycoside 6-adenylyltransferase
MFDPPERDQVLEELVRWGGDRADVRAMILTSTRADPEANPDPFSDYDVIVAVTDTRPFYEDRGWLDDFGRVLVLYRDPMRTVRGGEQFAYITQYDNGLKIDLTLCSTGVLDYIASRPSLPDDLDVGCAVLLDKDDLTRGLAPATRGAYVPEPPGEGAYRELIEEFLHEATYVAKHLWRDDLLPAKYNLDHAMKQVNLRRMLEWRIEADHGWALPTRAYGKGLKRLLPEDSWQELAATYAGAGIEENWDALFRTIDFFRTVATEVGERLGFDYPDDLDERVVRYLKEVRNLERRAD